MDLSILMPVTVTITHLIGVLLRYVPFRDVLSRKQKRGMLVSYLVLAVIMFPIYMHIFANPATRVPYLKIAFTMGAFVYVAATLFWFHTRLAQQLYIFGMQGLWVSTIHTAAGILIYYVLHIDTAQDQLFTISVIDPLCNLLLLPCSLYLFRRMRPSSLLMSDKSYGFYMALLPLAIVFIQVPQNLNMDQFFWNSNRILMRVITGICFFIMYKGVTLEDENLASEIHLRSVNDTQRKTIHFLQSYTLLVQQGSKKFSILRHDIRHHIQLVYALIHDDKKEEALKALESFDTQLDKTAVRPYSLNPYINAILSVYINRAREEGFSVTTQINFPESVPILEEQLAVVLANLMENAIRITSQEPKEKRFLEVHLQTKGKQAVLEVDNYCSKPIIFNAEGFPSTTKKGHGIGMVSTRRFIEHYKGYKDFSQTDGRVKFIIYFRMDVTESPYQKDD
ncbi:sensor histidine kinase [uncultured Dialister sp.]|uniref:sensor histidine kinase n=1 Tax=uncultured Dialister sp. TaxID=278064 RepID=UPI0025DCC704|nr:ATP-binding protein [uncultured Dialister sp.]